MSQCQLARCVAGFADRAEDFSVLIELHNPVVPAVDHPDMLIRCDKEAIRIADVGPFLEIVSVGIEDLNPLIFAVADVYVTTLVNNYAVGQIELAWSSPVAAP